MSRAWIERIFYSHSHTTTAHFAKYLSLDGFRALTTPKHTAHIIMPNTKRGESEGFSWERARAARLYPSRYENRNDMCQSAASRARDRGSVLADVRRPLAIVRVVFVDRGRRCRWLLRKTRLKNEGVSGAGAAVGERKMNRMILFVWWF